MLPGANPVAVGCVLPDATPAAPAALAAALVVVPAAAQKPVQTTARVAARPDAPGAVPAAALASAAVDADIRYVESKLQDGLTEEELEIFRRAAKKMLRNLQQSRDGEEKG